MTTTNKTTLARKATLALGALVISTMTVTGAAQAKSKINVHLDFSLHGLHGVHVGYGPTYGYGPYGNPCWKYWKKYKKTGKYYWKVKFKKCKMYYY